MPSHVFQTVWARSGEQISKSNTITADGEINLSVTLAANQTDFHAVVAVDVSALKSVLISSDQDVTIETNSGSSPAQTLTVKAGKPLAWYENNGQTCPLTTDVTDLYFTNVTAALVEIRLLQDVTP